MSLYELYQLYVKECHITITYEEFAKQYKAETEGSDDKDN